MARKLSIGVCVLASAALFAAVAPAAQAARTWAGTWSSGVGGEMVLDAGGSGTYSYGRGTIRGGVNGDVNRGTWDAGNGSTGTFKFTLEPDGLTFLGEGRYDDTSISGNAFAWNGTCIAGACLENGATGGGGSCQARSLDFGLFGATRADSCPGAVKFSFATRADELPDKPDKSQLPPGTVELEAVSSDTRLRYDPAAEYVAYGTIRLNIADSDDDESFIELELGAEGEYVRNGDLRRVNFDGSVEQSTHPDCDESHGFFDGAFAVKKERANLRLIFHGGCLSDQTILWKKAKKFRQASIKVGRG